MNKKLTRLLKGSLFAGMLFGVTNPAVAAYIESAIGNAVVYDATSVYFNPASMVMVKQPQLVTEATGSTVFAQFKGTTTQTATGYRQTGTADSRSNYFLPGVFYVRPLTDRITIGFGELYVDYGNINYPADSIVRYTGTHANISVLDLTPAVAVKIADEMSVGFGLDAERFSQTQDSMKGFPTLRIPDIKSDNVATAWSAGAHAGVLFQPVQATKIGLTYHTAVHFNATGKSTLYTQPKATNADDYYFSVVAPPSTVFSIDQFFTPRFGVMTTLERMQWSSIKNVTQHNVVTLVGRTPRVIPSASVPYYFHDTWRALVGLHYIATSRLLVRGALSYDQDPNNTSVQTASSPGADAIVTAIGATYKLTKALMIDMRYAHYFYQNKNINTTAGGNNQDGSLHQVRDALQVKLIIGFM
ncbi:MAG: hypothetical protein EPO11_10635 [Gammaproteobacteria bacterium]|nr:MAG: hypothetical protein EPO11_10635 [Gammaproteobacteria bacterium]